MKTYLVFFLIGALCFHYSESTFLNEATLSLESEMESSSNELVKGLNEVNKLKQTILDLVINHNLRL